MSEVGSGLLFWCNSRNVLQFGPWYYCTGNSVLNPEPTMRLCQPPDGSTSPKYKLLCFLTIMIIFTKSQMS
jgi:hypothetical protein